MKQVIFALIVALMLPLCSYAQSKKETKQQRKAEIEKQNVIKADSSKIKPSKSDDFFTEDDDFDGEMDTMFEEMSKMMKQMQRQMKQMSGFFDGIDNDSSFNMGRYSSGVSNSIQLNTVNGKSSLKINTTNSEISYVVDGNLITPDSSFSMPQLILSANMVNTGIDNKNMSYAIITSGQKLGKLTSFTDGKLCFDYNGQEYRYNTTILNKPILLINGMLYYDMEITQDDILQIRPISEIERKLGIYGTAEVFIITK